MINPAGERLSRTSPHPLLKVILGPTMERNMQAFCHANHLWQAFVIHQAKQLRSWTKRSWLKHVSENWVNFLGGRGGEEGRGDQGGVGDAQGSATSQDGRQLHCGKKEKSCWEENERWDKWKPSSVRRHQSRFTWPFDGGSEFDHYGEGGFGRHHCCNTRHIAFAGGEGAYMGWPWRWMGSKKLHAGSVCCIYPTI